MKMTMKEIRAHITMELEFVSPDWLGIQRMVEEAIRLEDARDYGYEKEPDNISKET